MKEGQALAVLWKTKQNTTKNKVTRREYVSGIPEGFFCHAACRGLTVVCKAVLVPVHQSCITKLPTGGVGGKKCGQNLFKSLLQCLLKVFSEISKHITAFVVCLLLGLNASFFQSRVKASFLFFLSLHTVNGNAMFHHTASRNIRKLHLIEFVSASSCGEKTSVRKSCMKGESSICVCYCSLNAGLLSKVGGKKAMKCC